MAARTLLFEIGGDGDVRAELNSNTLCRSFPASLVSTGWTKIRIGVRLSFQDGASITSTPRFAFGVCSGTTNPYDNGGGTTTNFIGVISDVATWNKTSNLYQLASASTDLRACTRVGTSLTLGTGLKGATQGQFTVLNATKRQLYFLDVEKGSPNYALQLFYPSSESTCVDQSRVNFQSQMVLPTPVVTGHTFGSSTPIAANESAGVFNAINISWDRSSPLVYISDFAIARFS